MNHFLRDFKGKKRKEATYFIDQVIDKKKQQIDQAKRLVETYKIQLSEMRKVKSNDYPIEQLWRLKE